MWGVPAPAVRFRKTKHAEYCARATSTGRLCLTLSYMGEAWPCFLDDWMFQPLLALLVKVRVIARVAALWDSFSYLSVVCPFASEKFLAVPPDISVSCAWCVQVLMQTTANTRSFCLYAKLGFQVKPCTSLCGFFVSPLLAVRLPLSLFAAVVVMQLRRKKRVLKVSQFLLWRNARTARCNARTPLSSGELYAVATSVAMQRAALYVCVCYPSTPLSTHQLWRFQPNILLFSARTSVPSLRVDRHVTRTYHATCNLRPTPPPPPRALRPHPYQAKHTCYYFGGFLSSSELPSPPVADTGKMSLTAMKAADVKDCANLFLAAHGSDSGWDREPDRCGPACLSRCELGGVVVRRGRRGKGRRAVAVSDTFGRLAAGWLIVVVHAYSYMMSIAQVKKNAYA